MPTLASIDGRTLAANVGPQLSQLAGILERDRIRDEEEAARKAREEELQALLEKLQAGQEKFQAGQAGQEFQIPPDVIDSGPERVKTLTDPVDPSQRTPDQQALGRIQALKPDVAKEVLQVIQGGDQEQLTQLKEQAQTGTALGDAILAAPDLAAKRKSVSDAGQAAVLQGQSPARTVELLNMDENHLNLEARRLQVIGNAVDSLLPTLSFVDTPEKVRAFARLLAISPEAANAFLAVEKLRQTRAKPLTDIGKARDDLRKGKITRDDFNTIKNTPKKLQSKIGKLINDLQIIKETYGEDSPQMDAYNELIKAEQKGDAPKLTDVSGQRKEFTKLSGPFIIIRDSFAKIEQAADNPSAAGDLSMVFNFMRLLDPGSTVREGEFANAEQSAGVPDRVRNIYNRLRTGERLGEKQRLDFVQTARRIFETTLNTQVKLEQTFKDLAERSGIDPKQVAIDFIGDSRKGPAFDLGAGLTNEKTVDQPGTTLKEGDIFIFPDGTQGMIDADGNVVIP